MTLSPLNRRALFMAISAAVIAAVGSVDLAASGPSARGYEAVDLGYVISYSQEARARRGPAGDWPDSGCFTWEFQIDKDGVPYNLSAVIPSRHYGFHVSMQATLRDFRFRVAPGADTNALYRIGFHYEQGNISAGSVPSCPKP